jgi:hypothetical protein
MSAQKIHYFMFSIGFGTPNESMSVLNVKVVMHSLFGLYLNMKKIVQLILISHYKIY